MTDEGIPEYIVFCSTFQGMFKHAAFIPLAAGSRTGAIELLGTGNKPLEFF